jgi:hypothetical protein
VSFAHGTNSEMQSWFVSFKLYLQPAHLIALSAVVPSDGDDPNTKTWTALLGGRSLYLSSAVWNYTNININSTKSIEHGPSWNSLSCSRNSTPFMEAESSLPYSQKPNTGPYPEPHESTPHFFTLSSGCEWRTRPPGKNGRFEYTEQSRTADKEWSLRNGLGRLLWINNLS